MQHVPDSAFMSKYECHVEQPVTVIDPNYTLDESKAFWCKLPLNTPQVFEFFRQKKDGTWFPVEISGKKIDSVFNRFIQAEPGRGTTFYVVLPWS